MPFENRLRHMGEGSSAYTEWKNFVTNLVNQLDNQGHQKVLGIVKILKEHPMPKNPYKEGTLKYEFWRTGFETAKLDSPIHLYR